MGSLSCLEASSCPSLIVVGLILRYKTGSGSRGASWWWQLTTFRGHSTLCCAGAGHPSLSSRPELVEQWHPTNNKATASLQLGSNLRAWWLCRACACGHPHKWQAGVNARALNNAGCPVCAGAHPCRCSSLAVLRPDLAAQWHPTGNRELVPEGVALHSHKKVQWVCRKHGAPFSCAAIVGNCSKPHRPSGCPQCAHNARRPRQGMHRPNYVCAGTSGSSQGQGHYRHASDPQGARLSWQRTGNCLQWQRWTLSGQA